MNTPTYSCLGKRQYPDVRTARAVAKSMRRRTGERINTYRCHACGYYHLGASPEHVRDARRDAEDAWRTTLA